MLRDHPRRPEHTVLAVQLRGQRPASPAVVHAALSEPSGELAVSVEPVSEPRVTDDVVDRTEPVVRAADGRVEERMAAIAVEAGRAQLEHPVRPNALRQLLARRVGLRASSVRDAYR